MPVKIRDFALELPLIQGGMGIGISLSGLAGAVAGCGAMGVISTANAGYREADFVAKPFEANLRALAEEVKKAKEIAKGKGMVAINAMVATTQFADSVRAAVAAGVDAVISGAGLPTTLPELVQGSGAAIAPIVSSGRAAKTLLKLWDKHYGATADFVVVEGPLAGGHLGFSKEDLLQGSAEPLESSVPAVIEAVKPYEEKYGHPIPVFAAGGIFTGADMARFTQMGAAGAQIATRFIATYECDAAQGYKDRMLAAKEEDAHIVQSPVGMPGRALRSPLFDKIYKDGRIAPKRCSRCIVTCDPATTPYCITHALMEAAKGNWEEGLFFCGSNVGRVIEMRHACDLVQEIMAEWEAAKAQ